jgi:hypothetical protein
MEAGSAWSSLEGQDASGTDVARVVGYVSVHGDGTHPPQASPQDPAQARTDGLRGGPQGAAPRAISHARSATAVTPFLRAQWAQQ